MSELNFGQIVVENGSFTHVYEQVCNALRSDPLNNLETFKNEFQKLHNDWDRVKLIGQLCDFKRFLIKKDVTKDIKKALEYEQLYDQSTVDSNIRLGNSLQFISKSLQHTAADDQKSLSRRYSKRAWSQLHIEDFESATKDATRSLKHITDSVFAWKSHEILGHCFAKTGKYAESRTSFARALELLRISDESNPVKAQAAMRMANVIKGIKGFEEKSITPKSTKQEFQLPTPFGGRNEILSSASSRVTLENTETNGRGLFAKEDIKPGSIIIAENPYAAVLNDCKWESNCIHCLKIVVAPVPCDGCSKVWFCSEDCKFDVNYFHHRECPILPYLYNDTLGVMAPLVVRVILTRGFNSFIQYRSTLEELAASNGQDYDSNLYDKYSSKNYFAVFNQITNSDKRTFGNVFKRGLAAIYLTHCLKSISFFEKEPSSDELNYIAGLILRHLQSCSCNAYEICVWMKSTQDIDSRCVKAIGGAIYSTISLTNHSCAPNCYRYNAGIAGILRASKLIKKGEEIYDNYGHFYYMEDIRERRKALKSNYMFDCHCIACTNAWLTYASEKNELYFSCPQTNCSNVITDYFGVRGCEVCCDKKLYKKFLLRIKQKVNNFDDVKDLLKAGKTNEACSLILEQQMFMDSFSVGSSKHYIRVQEMLCHCYLQISTDYSY